jgi:hypothetical protein
MTPQEFMKAPPGGVVRQAAAGVRGLAGPFLRSGRDKIGPYLTRRNVLGAGVAAAGAAAAAGLGVHLLKRPAPKGIVLIVIDALSKDRVGYAAQTAKGALQLTPYLDFLAETGASFDMAIAPSSHTCISMPSIFYDVAPFRVGYTSEGLTVNGAGASLASRLSGRGWFTGAIIANRPLDAPITREGFGDYVALKPDMSKRTTDVRACLAPISGPAVLAELARMCERIEDARPESFFLYVHYMHTHDPYQCMEQDLERFGVVYNTACTPGKARRAVEAKSEFLSEGLPLEKGIEALRCHYDAAAMGASRAVKRTLAILDRSGLLSRSLVVVTADHGEERGFPNVEAAATFGHSRNVSLNETHVPLVVWSPAGAVRGAFAQPVSSARVINDAVAALAEGSFEDVNAALATSARAAAPIVSYLDIVDPAEGFAFCGFAFTNANLRVLGDYVDGPVLRAAFQLGAVSGPRAVPLDSLPPGIADVVSAQFAQGRVEGINPSNMSPQDREKLRALGYIN